MTHYLNAMRRYFDFGGRSSRPEFWFFTLAFFVLSIVAALIDRAIFGVDAGERAPLVSGIVSLVHLIPGTAVSVRRLHDIDRTGFWVLLGFLPSILFFVLLATSLALIFSGSTEQGVYAMAAALVIVGLVALAVVIALIVFYCTPGTPGENRFGPPPG